MYYNLLEKGFLKDDEDIEPHVEGFEFYFEAFSEISTTRQFGMSIGPIPFTAIVEYFNIYDLEDFEEFSYVIRRMDKVYLELNNKVVNKVADKGGKESSGGHNSNKKNSNKS